LAKLIEYTHLGAKTYYGLSHKDIYRITGNFAFDYKKIQAKKSPKKIHQLGKDTLVLTDLFISIDKYAFDIKQDRYIFITSDYPFFRELSTFQSDITYRNLLEQDYYQDLSEYFKSTISEFIPTLNILKLDIQKYQFENTQQQTSRCITDLL